MKLEKLLQTYSQADLVYGSADTSILGICKTTDLIDSHLVYAKDKKFLKEIKESLSQKSHLKIGLVYESKVKEEVLGLGHELLFQIEVPSIDEALCRFSELFYQEKLSEIDMTKDCSSHYQDSHQLAENIFIGENVELGKNVILMSGVRVMANSKIGEGSIIYPNTVVYPFCQIGKFCRVHAHATIGADGFGYNFINGQHMKVWHFGGVKIGDYVEIGANSCVDSGSFQPTIIGSGSKIDNLVQVGHNVEIGEHVVLCGQVGLGGSSKIDAYSALGGKAALGPGSHLGMATQLAGGAMATGNWPAKSRLAGYPAFEARKWLRSISKFKQLGNSK